MAGFTVALATPEDDAGLRRILRETVMPGQMTLSFEREPCFFTAAPVEGPFHQTLVGRDDRGEIVVMGSRAVRDCYVNGEVMPVGYAGLLRVAPHYPLGGALPKVLDRGFRLFRELHEDRRTPFYLMSVMEGNRSAQRLLTAGLAGWPGLRPWIRLTTHCLAVGRARRMPCLPRGAQLVRGSADMLPEIAACLQRVGLRRQLTPVWDAPALAALAALDLAAADFWVVCRGDIVVGCAARWNQRRFKQTVVGGYGRAPALARPLINALAWISARPQLPRVGEQVRFAFLSHLAVEDDDPQVAAALIAAVYNAAAAAGDHYLMLGLAVGDARRAWLCPYHTIDLESRLYLASWEDGRAAVAAIDDRPPGVEIAVL